MRCEAKGTSVNRAIHLVGEACGLSRKDGTCNRVRRRAATAAKWIVRSIVPDEKLRDACRIPLDCSARFGKVDVVALAKGGTCSRVGSPSRVFDASSERHP